MSFRAKDENAEQWDPERLKRNYPSALPVFSVETEEEADQLITLCCSKGWHSNRYGVPHVLQFSIENFDAVAAHLAKGYGHLTRVKPVKE